MDQDLRAFAAELYQRSWAHDVTQPDRLLRYRNLEPESAEVLAVLATAVGPRRMLELGTSNGYSTLFLADAARLTGSGLVSVDVDEHRISAAAANLEAVGLRARVDLCTADAAAVLAGSADAAWDLVFLDAERPAYPAYWPDLLRSLAPGGLLVVDNVLSHADQVVAFRALVDGEPGVRSAVLPVGAGLLAVVTPPSPG